METSMIQPFLSKIGWYLVHTCIYMLLQFDVILVMCQVFHGEAGHGGVCTCTKDQQNHYCISPVTADNKHNDPEPQK